jgi:hypothetical protein
MRSLAADPEVGANFLVLLITKRDNDGRFQATATVFLANSPPLLALLQVETEPAPKTGVLMQWLRGILSF